MRLISLLPLITHTYAFPLLKAYAKKKEEGLPRDSPEFLLKILVSTGLVLAGGVFAG